MLGAANAWPLRQMMRTATNNFMMMNLMQIMGGSQT